MIIFVKLSQYAKKKDHQLFVKTQYMCTTIQFHHVVMHAMSRSIYVKQKPFFLDCTA